MKSSPQLHRSNPSENRKRTRRRGKGEGSIFPRSGTGGVFYIQWRDEFGRVCTRSTKSRDRAIAQQILAVEIRRVVRLREGVITREDEDRKKGMSADILKHLDDYMNWCSLQKQNPRAMLQKRRNLEEWFRSSAIKSLGQCSAESLQDFLAKRQTIRKGRALEIAGTGARVWNQIRSQASAFLNWCKRRGYLSVNPVALVPAMPEREDLRRKRRALTRDEVSRLLAVARKVDREAWYLCALRAGLRKSDLQRLDWSNISFQKGGTGEIRFPIQKAKRTDTLPIDKVLVRVLRKRHERSGSPKSGLVFPETVTDRTRKRDFERANIPLRDETGRVVDLHSCRMTLVMALIRNGASVLSASKIMRHRDLKTTMSYYTDVVAEDLRKDLNKAYAEL